MSHVIEKCFQRINVNEIIFAGVAFSDIVSSEIWNHYWTWTCCFYYQWSIFSSCNTENSRIVGIVCINPSCRTMPFASMHCQCAAACEQPQNRRHPSKKGTLCSKLTSMSETVVNIRAIIATGVLRREHKPGTAHVLFSGWWLFMNISVKYAKYYKIIRIKTMQEGGTCKKTPPCV